MTLSNPKQFYSHFLKGHEGKLHFAAHSHHFWPDVSREGHMAYWDDCAKSSDKKWDGIFSKTIPKAQKHIANILNLKDHAQIVFAPNTHELSARLLSIFLGKPELKILTTTNEFHSWRRQYLRLSELSQVKVTEVDTNNFLNNRELILENLKMELANNYDLIFLSQVFFDSGCALTDAEIKSLVSATPASTLFILDGYHAFGALPTDLSALEGRIFYLGGGYKYAQAGEGVGFMVVPKGEWRPANTGWFAEYAQLNQVAESKVGYAPDAMAFMGATQDPSGFYRFNAVWDYFTSQGIDVESIHRYVLNLQKAFLADFPVKFIETWSLKPLFKPDLAWHGHFLTYEASSLDMAEKCQTALENSGIMIDRRGPRLRFGFGLYQSREDVSKLIMHLQKLA